MGGDPSWGYDVLAALSNLLATAEDGDEMLVRAVEQVRTVTGADVCLISQWDRGHGHLSTVAWSGDLTDDEVAAEGPSSLVGDLPVLLRFEAGSSGEYADVDDPATDAAERAHLVRTGRSSCLCLPVVVDGLVWGQVYLARASDAARYTSADLPFARALAAVVSAWVTQAGRLGLVRRLAYEDPLTGLANRRAIDERLDAALDTDGCGPVGLLVCDVNELKMYNDEFGHEAGDRVLTAVAVALSASMSVLPGALCGRVGGDEFCVVIPAHPADACLRLADEVSSRAAELLPEGAGLACGLACTEHLPAAAAATPAALFRIADAAQYRAKRSGSPVPVVAGRTAGRSTWSIPADPGPILPVAAGEPGPGADRRGARAQGRPSPARVLAAVSSALQAMEGAPVLDRLVTVADQVSAIVDGAGWWVSRAVEDEDVLETVAGAVARDPRMFVAQAQPPAAVGQRYALSEFPASAAAAAGGWFEVAPGRGGADPAEEAFVAAGGFAGSAGAGGRLGATGWLVEVYTDDLSTSVEALPQLLHALVAVALVGSAEAGSGGLGAAGTGPGGLPRQRLVDSSPGPGRDGSDAGRNTQRR